jgi:hypothetical protein
MKWRLILDNTFYVVSGVVFASGVFASGEPTGVYVGGTANVLPGMTNYGGTDVGFIKFDWTSGTTLYAAQVGGAGSELLTAFDVHPTVPDRAVGAGRFRSDYECVNLFFVIQVALCC